jgi:hypothetical protein
VQLTQQAVPVVVMIICLAVYTITVALMFRKDKLGFKRRWHLLDYIWVPLGGLTVVILLALWWRAR